MSRKLSTHLYRERLSRNRFTLGYLFINTTCAIRIVYSPLGIWHLKDDVFRFLMSACSDKPYFLLNRSPAVRFLRTFYKFHCPISDAWLRSLDRFWQDVDIDYFEILKKPRSHLMTFRGNWKFCKLSRTTGEKKTVSCERMNTSEHFYIA